MDPADSEALCQGLTTQGALIGQHDNVLTQVSSSLQELSANVAVLLGQAGSASAAHLPTALAPSPRQSLIYLLFFLFFSHWSRVFLRLEEGQFSTALFRLSGSQ